MEKEETIIRSKAQFDNLMAERRAKSDRREVNVEAMKEPEPDYKHVAVASQAIKVINSLRIDPFVKKVMTLRILGPMLTGNERTHISIALELGAPIDDVIQAEDYGRQLVAEMLYRVSTPEFVERYNRDKAVDNAVKGLTVTPTRGNPKEN